MFSPIQAAIFSVIKLKPVPGFKYCENKEVRTTFLSCIIGLLTMHVITYRPHLAILQYMHILYSCNNLFATSHLSLAKPSPNLSSLNLGKPNSNLAFSHRFWFHPILTSLRPISLATIYPNLATPSPNLAIPIYFGYTLPSWLSPSLFGYIPSQLGHSLYQLGHTHSNVATPVPYLATPHLCLAVWFYLAI